MLDLKRYGIAAQWPKLAKLQAEVRDLERRRAEAERDVMTARRAVEAARERDAEHAAQAVRAGKDMPPAKHEVRAKAQLEAAERTLAAYGKALEAAQGDLAGFMTEYRDEIRASILEALRAKAHRLAEHAREAAVLYGHLEDSRYDLRNLTPVSPASEPSGPPRDVTTVMGIAHTQSTGPPRGHVEQMLSYLAALEGQFEEPVEDPQQGAA